MQCLISRRTSVFAAREGGRGVVVKQVLRGSPGAVAGLQKGDVIARLDATHVASTEDVYRFIARHTPGQRVRVVVRRRGRPTVLSLRLGQKPRDAERQFRDKVPGVQCSVIRSDRSVGSVQSDDRTTNPGPLNSRFQHLRLAGLAAAAVA